MEHVDLDAGDAELIEHCRALATQHFLPGRHQVFAAVQTADGQVFDGIHIEAMIGRASVCAESVALGNMVLTGPSRQPVTRIVAIRGTEDGMGRVVSPCGLCRELISDYAPDARLIVLTQDGLQAMSPHDLLPLKYRGTKWIGERSRS